jgi:copper(I)-binding protein
MREVADGLVLAPGATVTLTPGGYHLMLTDIRKQLSRLTACPSR